MLVEEKKHPFFSTALFCLTTVQLFAVFIFLCVCVSETLLFNTFVYQKRQSFGYIDWEKDDPITEESYGARARDFDSLTQTMNHGYRNSLRRSSGARTSPFPSPEIVDSENKTIRIALIGDSFLWGQGVREQHRSAYLLQQRLNAHGKFTVESYSLPGDNLLDNYIKYAYLEKNIDQPDFYIFGLVNNDLVLNRPDIYDPNIVQAFLKRCEPKPAYFYNKSDEYALQLKNSIDPHFSNTCILDQIAQKLPQSNALYIDLQLPLDNDYMPTYLQALRNNELETVQSTLLIEQKLKPSQLLVSEKERHPSKYAHALYAEIMEEAVLTFVHRQGLSL